MPNNRKERDKQKYELKVGFQEDNHEARGEPENQTKDRNIRDSQAEGRPRGRNKY